MKIDCNQCKKEFDLESNIKNRVVAGLSLKMIICPECKTIFPSGVNNNNIKGRIKKIRKLQDKREKIGARAAGKPTVEQLKKLDDLYQEERKLVELNRQEGKQLLQKHYKLFEKFGKVYNPLENIVNSLRAE